MGRVLRAQVSGVRASPGVDGGSLVVRRADEAGVGKRVRERHGVGAGVGGASAAGALDSELARAIAGGAAAHATNASHRNAGGGEVLGAARTGDGESVAGEKEASRHVLI